ncbi:hypothetical protein F4810DRAFT_723472 [Camillea tinctor]|nr:hypothetical protein F4810DRAFT_723472 [Camillea tinctor]
MVHHRGLPAALLLFLFINIASPLFQPPAGLAALDDAAFTPNFAPRWYMDAAPASAAQAKRQADQCNAGQHRCLEVGPLGASSCCEYDEYCVVNASWGVQCCALGSSCGQPCPEDTFLCNSTATSSLTQTTVIAPSDGDTGSPVTTENVIPYPVTSIGCCPRPCASASYQCAPNFGSQCCPNNATCISGGNCVIPPPTTTPYSTRVTIVPEGCTTSQITCTDGGGCCDVGSTCTSQMVSSTAALLCAPDLPVRSGSLSSSARAGIGAGIAVGAALVIAALTWFCLRRRRRAASGAGSGVGMRHLDRGAGDGEASESLVARAHRNRNRATMLTAAGGGGGGTVRGGRAPSEPEGPGSAVYYREGGYGRHDYLGPDAVVGPYTEDANTPAPPAMSPGVGGGGRGVPVMPMDPDDIVPPVEIDSRIRGLSIGSRNEEIERDLMIAGKKSGAAGVSPPEKRVMRNVEGMTAGAQEKEMMLAQEDEEQSGPFELYGSPPVSPPPISPPMSPDYFSRQAMSPSPEMGSRYSGER